MNIVLTAVFIVDVTPVVLSRIIAEDYRNEDPTTYRPHLVSSTRVRC